MSFKIDEQVVYPAYGVGRIVRLVMKEYLEAEARPYYEIAIGKNTLWVLVEAADRVTMLRPVTPKANLAQYREVLRGCPETLTADPRQRQQEVNRRLKRGSFLDVCEIVRDLSARSWYRSPGESDSALLRKTRDALCEEWVAADGSSLPAAVAEINALLFEARQTYFSTRAASEGKSRSHAPASAGHQK